MSEPTPEERGKTMYDVTVNTMLQVGSPRPIPSADWYAAQVRAAVQAERERCVGVVKSFHGWTRDAKVHDCLRSIEAAMREGT